MGVRVSIRPKMAEVHLESSDFGGFVFDSGGKTRSILGIAWKFRIYLIVTTHLRGIIKR